MAEEVSPPCGRWSCDPSSVFTAAWQKASGKVSVSLRWLVMVAGCLNTTRGRLKALCSNIRIQYAVVHPQLHVVWFIMQRQWKIGSCPDFLHTPLPSGDGSIAGRTQNYCYSWLKWSLGMFHVETNTTRMNETTSNLFFSILAKYFCWEEKKNQ